MNPHSLCMGCMADTNASAICPYCAYAYDVPAESEIQLAPRTVLINRYVLGRVLGQGGFGITYLARDLASNRKLAIKEYFPAIISTRARDRMTVTPLSSRNRQDLAYGLEKFQEEGCALFRFRDHPNVVTMLEFFHANETGYIVMLYMEGQTFKEHLLSRGGRITFPEALKHLTLVMHALEDLHAAGILHRDVSPDNIYLENGGGVRILDFGATRYAMGEQSRSLSVVLKPGYAPEEQYRSRGKQGPWTDIYALGATFYRAITGRVPPESMDRQQSDELVAPSLLGVDIPPRCEGALLKALAVKAADRFQSIVELREAITPPPDPPAQLQRSTKATVLPGLALLFTLCVIAAMNPAMWSFLLISQILLFALTVALVFLMWRSIEAEDTYVTPGRAAALLCIPVFNFYWVFPAVYGFAGAFNRFVERRSRSLPRLDPKLFLLCSVSFVVYWTVSLIFGGRATALALVLHGCFLFPVVVAICNGVDAIRASGPARAAPNPGTSTRIVVRVSLRCLHGEYQGQEIEIGDREVVMGRSPTLANLVLTSGEVSNRHVRVYGDVANAGAWIEDLRSTNGTFYRKAAESAWQRLENRNLLSHGDRFRISTDAAEFEITVT